jgi:hypothetical protein
MSVSGVAEQPGTECRVIGQPDCPASIADGEPSSRVPSTFVSLED